MSKLYTRRSGKLHKNLLLVQVPLCRKRRGQDQLTHFKILHPNVISPQRLMLETSNFVNGSAMRSLSLVMSECFLSGHGQGHVSNFCIVDLENFATASRRYKGDIHYSTVVGLFMTAIRQWKPLDRVMVECTCLLHIALL